MFTVDEIIYNMQHFEEENFERFDEIYDEVRAGNFTVEDDAVVRLCRSFMEPFDQLHPHQYVKAVKITYNIINKLGLEEGFSQLVEGLSELRETEKEYVLLYMKMLMYGYGRNDFELFKLILEKNENKAIICQSIKEVCQTDDENINVAKEVFVI